MLITIRSRKEREKERERERERERGGRINAEWRGTKMQRGDGICARKRGGTLLSGLVLFN